MRRLGIVAVGLALVVTLASCTRTPERVVVVTATPSTPSPTPVPNLSEQEVIGLVTHRQTEQQPGYPEAGTWGRRAVFDCIFRTEGFEGLQASRERESPFLPEWTAVMERPGKWRVELACIWAGEGEPPLVFIVASQTLEHARVVEDVAVWTVDDETLRIIPVGGWAD